MSDSPLQAMVDEMNAQWQRERAQEQLTLGKLIATLEQAPADTLIDGICSPHSYRGYYCDLAFERAAEKITVAAALALCRNCMGEVFMGYKGGDYVMGAQTPLWLSSYGTTGVKMMGLRANGTFETAEDA